MSLPRPPEDWRDLVDFPPRIWRANVPLYRVHRTTYGTMHFATDQDSRWNPPDDNSPWGTCYLSTDPLGAALEVFGSLAFVKQRDLDARVEATVYVPSDIKLADMTHASIVGRFGLTAEASAGDEVSTYPITQAWAEQLREAGFSGVHYAARHDPTLASRSVALFGKAVASGDTNASVAEWDHESIVEAGPISAGVRNGLRAFGFTILGGSTL